MPPLSDDLLITTPRGLYCPSGDFFVDPWSAVPRAVVTHAHSDHCVFGCGEYLCSPKCAIALRERVGREATIQTLAYGQRLEVGGTAISLHPAGHILGSAQVRVKAPGAPVWVVSGDYKTAPDSTCDAFEPVRCEVFITESTFGLPIYRWPEQASVLASINAWWAANAREERTSIILAYALGKAQRVLAGLDSGVGPIGVHGAVDRFCRAYAAAGVALPAHVHASGEHVAELKGRGLIVAPPSALGSPWVRKFASSAGGVSAAFVSGWMRVRGARRRKAVDRGFVLSDHADWPGLLGAIGATGASRVGVTHGYVAPLVRHLRESGLDAFDVPTRFSGEVGEEQAGAERLDEENAEPRAPGVDATGEGRA